MAAEGQLFYLKSYLLNITVLLTAITIYSCHTSLSNDTAREASTTPKVAPESLHFTPHIVKQQSDGSKEEIDTLTQKILL
jgi:hypothetical protein